MEEGAAALERAQGRSASAPSGGASFGRVLQPHVPDFAHGVALYLDAISVSFDGFKALNELSLAIDVGELRCIIGPNGAGKTTMMDVITGKTRPDEGEVVFDGRADLTKLDEADIATLGIGRKFQKPTVFERHTVFENLELAMKCDKRVWPTLGAALDSSASDRILSTMEQIRLADAARRPAGVLSHGQKQWLEIGMLLMQEPELLLLDEPVAGMSDDETMRSAELFLSLAGQYTLIVVEHDMAFVEKIADTVTVLHEGHVLAEGSMHKIQQDERVIEVFLGR
jgi:urea transport system ATP-binding protein